MILPQNVRPYARKFQIIPWNTSNKSNPQKHKSKWRRQQVKLNVPQNLETLISSDHLV